LLPPVPLIKLSNVSGVFYIGTPTLPSNLCRVSLEVCKNYQSNTFCELFIIEINLKPSSLPFVTTFRVQLNFATINTI